MLGEGDELLDLARVVGDLPQSGGGVALLQPLQRLVRRGQLGAHARGLGTDVLDDRGGLADLRDGALELTRLLVQQVLGPVGQLRDACVALAQLLRGVRDVVGVELVQPERLAEVGADARDGGAQVRGRGLPELGDGEVQLVRRQAQALVRLDESAARALRELAVALALLLLVLLPARATPEERCHEGECRSGAWARARG
ncbi:hypothetical protein GCM10025875_07770 [Litorihabitans aurantiacus]|uniref:Uncharacterized protein n=1 Tax=Litorihabitans aurantiacus TaxID=1930061 RepID=A0AA37UT88_9MICO|nr:hypothetical protein GCM10025875_07770 [Litorihabitans aurantiacus]